MPGAREVNGVLRAKSRAIVNNEGPNPKGRPPIFAFFIAIAAILVDPTSL